MGVGWSGSGRGGGRGECLRTMEQQRSKYCYEQVKLEYINFSVDVVIKLMLCTEV